MIFKNNKVYDVLKWISGTVLTAAAVLVLALGNQWHIPHAEAIAGTLTAVASFMCTILGISANVYEKQRQEEEKKDE